MARLLKLMFVSFVRILQLIIPLHLVITPHVIFAGYA